MMRCSRGASALLVALLGLVGLPACGQAGPAPSSAALPPGVIARVGGEPVAADEVGRIARAQQVSPAEARHIAVRDTLFAREATSRGLSGAGDARASWDGELARRLLRRLLDEARATPLTASELDAAALRRWLEVDRPEGSRTVHAVVLSDAKDSDDKKARARALAEALRAAVLPVAGRAATLVPLPGAPPPSARIAPADDPDPLSGAFRQAVAAVPADGLQVVAEPLPPVAEDGHVLVAGNEWFDTDYSRAASALPARGAVSPLIRSSFGFHVIMLLERTPPLVLQGEARAAKLHDDIVNERARAAEKRLLEGLKGQRSVAPDAQGLLGLVGVDP